MNYEVYLDMLSKIGDDYDLFIKQYNDTFLVGTRSLETQQAYLDRMASLYTDTVKLLDKLKNCAIKYDDDMQPHIKDTLLFTAYSDFMKKHDHIDKFVEAVNRANINKEADIANVKNLTVLNRKALIENDPELLNRANEGKLNVYMSNADNTVTEEQRKGIADFERWLYRNCDKTGISLLGGKSKRDFVNEFVKLPTRVKLNTLYLLQNGKDKTAQTDEDLKKSQKSYVPKLSKIKDKMIKSKAKVWTRFNGTQFNWKKLQQTISIAKDKEEELKAFTFDEIDIRTGMLTDEDVEDIEREDAVYQVEQYELIKPEKLIELDAEIKNADDVKKRFESNEKVYESVRVDKITNTGSIKSADSLNHLYQAVSYSNYAKSGVEKGVGMIKPIAGNASKILNAVGNSASWAAGTLMLAVDGLNLNNIRARIKKMGQVINEGKSLLSDIVSKLKESNSDLFKKDIKTEDGFDVIPGMMLASLSKEELESLSPQDKELYDLGMDLRSQVAIAKQDYQEASRHESIAEKLVGIDITQLAIAGCSFIPGAQPVTLVVGGLGTAYYFKLLYDNEKLSQKDQQEALDQTIKTDNLIEEAKKNLNLRKDMLDKPEDIKKIDALLEDEKAIKEQIRSEIVTENNYVDLRAWYLANKGNQMVHLVDLADKYKNRLENRAEEISDEIAKKKQDLINKVRNKIKGNSEEMLQAVNKSESDAKEKAIEKSPERAEAKTEVKVVDKERISVKDLQEASKHDYITSKENNKQKQDLEIKSL